MARSQSKPSKKTPAKPAQKMPARKSSAKRLPTKIKKSAATSAPSARLASKVCDDLSCECEPTPHCADPNCERPPSQDSDRDFKPCDISEYASFFPCAIGQPQFSMPIRAKVLSTLLENDKVSLLTLDVQMEATPGQFVMVWLPGQEEKPMSIAEIKPNLQLAIARAGPASTKMADTKPGDYLYLRGPLGQGYVSKGKRWLLVGGGYGFAPLRFIARLGLERGAHVESINGARTKGLLMKAAPGKNHYTTDDGSAGTKGNVLTALVPLLKSSKWDCVYCCGPEKMMEAVAIACQKAHVPSQLSVERYMKCGFGVCGHCAMGDWLSCWDGPTISGEQALANPEFGKIHKDKAGRPVKY